VPIQPVGKPAQARLLHCLVKLVSTDQQQQVNLVGHAQFFVALAGGLVGLADTVSRKYPVLGTSK